MAELNDPTPDQTAAHTVAETAPATERLLRARIAELEALLEARTQTIVGLGARVLEMQGNAPPALSERLRAVEAELAQLQATKVLRYSNVPRRVYARVRAMLRG
jgi:hypothetical protein